MSEFTVYVTRSREGDTYVGMTDDLAVLEMQNAGLKKELAVDESKEPQSALTDQVEDVSDSARDKLWKRGIYLLILSSKYSKGLNRYTQTSTPIYLTVISFEPRTWNLLIFRPI